jgi:Uma2 family endonuclease
MEAAEPRVVIEVLSPSTLNVDRFRKVEEHKSRASIMAILLVDSRAARVGVWRRAGSEWNFEEHEGDAGAVALPEIGAVLSLDELYAGYGFEDQA